LSGQHDQIKEKYGLVRGLGLVEAVAANMTNMVGFGPFVTIPLIIATMGGPQCMLGWLAGTILSICDGMVWSELAAAMPGSGGSYLFLKEAFKTSRLSAILPFLFIWQFMASGPLEVSSCYIGFVQYLKYFFPTLGPWQGRFLILIMGIVTVVLLYRQIHAIGKLMLLLWAGMLLAVGPVIAGGLIHIARFGPGPAFDFPPGAFQFSTGFALGLGRAVLIAMFDFLGYYNVCYVGGEVKNPERTLPRAIFWSVLGVATIYSLMNFCVISVVPWREAMRSQLIMSDYMQRLYGVWGARTTTVLVLWAAYVAAVPILLGYSRIPYAAALDGHFFKPFVRLHASGFPYFSLLVVGGLSIIAGMFDLEWVITAMLTTRILVQFVAQIFAVHYLRKYRTDLERPFRVWLYPVPNAIAFLGWTYIFVTSGARPILFGLGTLAAGVVAFWVWRRNAGLPVFPVTAGR